MKIGLKTRISLISLGLLAAIGSLNACAAEAEGDESVAPPIAPGQTTTLGGAGRAMGGELIIQYRAGASAAGKARARGRANAAFKESISSLDGTDLELATLPPGLALHAAAQALTADPDVDFAEPNFTVQHQAVGQDTSYGQLWGLENSGQLVNQSGTRASTGAADVDMDVPNAWAQIAATENPLRGKVYVGVIDEGIDFSHPDLAGVVGNPGESGTFCNDGIDNDGNGKVDDCYGWDFVSGDKTIYDGTTRKPADAHGTHVTGTIAANRNNAMGVAGVASNVGVISAKFLGTSGGTTAASINAVNYLTDLKKNRGVNLVASNNSWGGGGFSEALYNAIKTSADEGILFIVAAGNETVNVETTPSYPCSYGRAQTTSTFSKGKVTTKSYPALTNIICVAAHDQFGKIASFSNWGSTTVHVAAPGVNILSTTPGNTYAFYAGTSMATPHVTGLVALLAGEGLSTAEIQRRVSASAVVVPEEGFVGKTVTGGRVNALRALNDSTGPDTQP